MDFTAHFVCDPATCGGETVFRGTRVLLRAVLADLADGASTQNILKDFPSLTAEHVRAAIALAAAAARDDVRAKVDAGLQDLDAGHAAPHEQLMREAAEWLRNRYQGAKPVDDRGRGNRPVMILVEITEAPASVKGWVARARKVPVVLTIKGRPVAAVTPLDEGDWERLVVSCHPAFRRILEQSRAGCPAGQGISTEEMRRRLKRRRAAAAARPSSRRAPRPARHSRPSKRR